MKKEEYTIKGIQKLLDDEDNIVNIYCKEHGEVRVLALKKFETDDSWPKDASGWAFVHELCPMGGWFRPIEEEEDELLIPVEDVKQIELSRVVKVVVGKLLVGGHWTG